MLEQYENTIKNIQKALNKLASDISCENQSGSTSLAKYAESYFKPIFNILIEGSPFQVMPGINDATIDLVNESRSVRIQVSSEKNINTKIKDTLKGNLKSSSTSERPRLFFLFIAEEHTKPQKKTREQLKKDATQKGYNFRFENNVIILKSGFTSLLTKLYGSKEEGFNKIDPLSLQFIEKYLQGLSGLEPYLYSHHQNSSRTRSYYEASAKEVLGREEDLDKILDFYDDEKKKVLFISAEPGMGKTSLCYKFFEDNKFDPFIFDKASEAIINSSGLATNSLFKDRKTLFFLDDLQNFITDKSFMDTLSNLARDNNQAKFIITLRSKWLLPEGSLIGEGPYVRFQRDIVSEHSLGRLSDETVKEIVSKEIKNFLEKPQYISAIVEKIAGIPILLKHILNCLQNGEDVNSSTPDREGHLVNLIENYINELKRAWAEEGDIKDQSIDQILFLAALQNEIDTSKLDSLFLTIGDVTELFNHLLQKASESEILFSQLSKQRYQIRPELFSDAILVHYFFKDPYHIKTFYNTLLNTDSNENPRRLELIFNRLLKLNNESFDAYDIDPQTIRTRIKDLKKEVFFKKKIGNLGELYSFESRLKILSSIAYRNPNFVLETLREIYNEQLSNNDFFLNIIKNDRRSLESLEKTIQEQFQIIMLNSNDISSLDNSYELLMNYFRLFQNSHFIEEAFRYLHYDFSEYGYYREKPLFRQKYFLDKLKKKIKETKSFNDDSFNFIYSGLTVLLSLECKDYSYWDCDQVHWYNNLWVYPNPDLIIIRNESLIMIQSLVKDADIKEKQKMEIYKFLLHEFWFIKTHSRKGSSPIDRTGEVNQIFDFFIKELKETPSLELKAAILNTFRLYKDDEIKEEFSNRKKELISLASNTKDTQEKLALLYLNEFSILDKNLDNEIAELIKSFNNINEFIDTLIQFLENFKEKEWSHSFSSTVFESIIAHISNKHRNQSKTIYDYIYENYNSYKYQFISLLSPFFNEEDFFYSLLERLWNPEDVQSHASLSWMILHGRDPKIFKEKDLKYLQTMLQQKNGMALRRISFSIYKYFNISFSKTKNLIEQTWKLAEQEPLYFNLKQDILSSLFRNKELNEKFKAELKLFIEEFFINRINPFDEDSRELLNFIENYFGFKELLDLMKKIIEKDPQPRMIYQTYKNKSKSEEESVKRYIEVLDFYFSQNTEENDSYDSLIDYFLPHETSSFGETQITATLLVELNHYFDSIKETNINGAKELLNFLSNQFYVDERLCDFLVKAAIYLEKNLSSENLSAELEQIFNEKFLKNRGLTRRRLAHEEVYPADLEKRQMLEKIIGKYQTELTDSRVLDFLKKALKNVNYDLGQKN